MSQTLFQLNELRSEKYLKDIKDEEFLMQMNRTLQPIEESGYEDIDIEYPMIFVYGLPRSGTTLMAQLIANSLDVGYINNLAARFWLAPVHGIRLARMILKEESKSLFQSDYARTADLSDIHEFGYYWRYWLKKDNFDGILHPLKYEAIIDWPGLRRSLANIQMQFKSTMVFKNIFGAYHLAKLKEVIQKVIYVYIKRDPLDVAISIYKARQKFYSDLNTWWSTLPLEYNNLKNLDYWQQIAGQVHYLAQYYDNQSRPFKPKALVEVEYEQLCRSPISVIEKICDLSSLQYGCDIPIKIRPPESFPYRRYDKEIQVRNKFQHLLDNFK